LSKFEYVTVFAAILLAFAVSEVLSGVGRLIRDRHRVTFYWVHLLWMALVVALATQYWWNLWVYRALEFSRYLEFTVLFIPTLPFIVIASLLSPTLPGEGDFDLRQYYFRNSSWVFPLAAAMFLAVGSLRAMLGLEPLLHAINGIRVLAILLLLWLAFSRSARVHEIAVVVAGVLFVASLAL
jgi:hypothetical protein